MGHTRFKKKKKRWATQKAKRAWSTYSKGGAMEKTKEVQQSFDTIHDFYKLLRGLFGLGLSPNMAALQQEFARATTSGNQSKIVEAQTNLTNAPLRVPLYETMRAVMQYMIIRLNSIVLNIQIAEGFTDININNTTQFAKYTGYKKPGQLFFQPPGPPAVPFSKVTTSGIEIQGREYFEIPPGREWPKLQDAAASFRNLTSLLFNLNDNPDQATVTAYYTALKQPVPEKWQTDPREFTAAHQIYMVCDAGANTYGKLAESVRAPGGKPGQKIWDGTHGTLFGPRLIELVTPLTTADSASSNPYQDHKFVFVASGEDTNVFVSDANLYTSDIYQIRYVRDQWNKDTGLGFKLVVSPRNAPNTILFELVYGILAEGQAPFVRPARSKAPPVIYNSQGPSAAELSGCVLIRALDSRFTDPSPNQVSKIPGVQDRIATPALRNEVVTELTRIMTEDNGVSPLCGTATMVDPYNRLGNRFGEFPPELWLDIKRGGDRDQVMTVYYLSKLKNADDELLYPFIHVVTGDELAAKMAVELGLAVIYQAGGNIRYWPKMFRFREQSRAIPPPYGIITNPPPQADQPPWAIAQWGGKRMKGGLRNPNGAIPSYTRIEDKDGVQYFFDNYNFGNSNGVMIMKGINDQGQNNRPNIIAHDIWLNPSNYVVMKNQVQPTNPTITPASLLADIRAQYQQIPQTPELPELPERELTADEWNTIASGLSNIDYRPLPPVIKQAIINVLQGIQLLQPDNRGIYQYDFINTLFGNNPQLNPLDELTFRIVYDSKEDDGLQGAAMIGENSPEVTVTSDDGQHRWTIPALLNTDLLKYDMNFMANRFLISLVLYFNDTSFTRVEIVNFMSGKTDAGGDLEENGSMPASRVFMINYGIKPIVSYIQAKYADFDLNGLENVVGTLITGGIGAAMQFYVPRISVAQPSAAASSVSIPIRSSVLPYISGQSSLGQPFSSLQPTQRTPLLQGTETRLNPTPSSIFGQAAAPTNFEGRYTLNLQTRKLKRKPNTVQPIEPAQPTGTGKFISKTRVQPTGSRPFAVPVHGIFNSKQKPTIGQPIGQAQRVQQPTGSRAFAVPVHNIFTSKQQQNQNNNNNNVNQRNAKRSKKTLFATTGATASAVRVGQGGRRRTQKNHKRKKHGTQRKRSHKGSMRRLKDKGSKSTSQ